MGVVLLANGASATELCSEVAESCKEKSVLAEGTEVAAKLKAETKAKFVTELGTVECKGASLKAKTSSKEEAPLPLEITEMSFSSCLLGKTECTATALHLPYQGSLFADEGGNGTLYVEEAGEGGEPGQTLKCGASLSCSYTDPELDLSLTAGTPTALAASEYELEEATGEHCAPAAKWSTQYALTAPNSGEAGASEGSQATALCEANEATCSMLYGFGQQIVGAKHRPPGVAIVYAPGTSKNIACATGSIVGKTEQNAGIPLLTELKNLAFGTCTIGLHTCTVKIEGLPYAATGLTAGNGGNGWWVVDIHLFVECPTENIRGCNYVKRVSFEFFGGTAGNAKVVIPNHLIKAQPGGIENCGRSARLAAIFDLTEPAGAVYLTH